MKIKNLKFGLYFLVIVSLFISCGDDDDDIIVIELRDRTEQQVADKDSLMDYLSTHYYNSSFFETGIDHKYSDIIITELAEGETEAPDGNTLLINAVETLTTTYFDTEYEYYVLNINQGSGKAPKFTDAVKVRYEGINVDGEDIFDVISTPANLNLQSNGFNVSGTIRAWQLIMPEFNSALGFTIGTDGVVTFDGFGLGIMFVPSGLAYFSGTNTGSSYANLIFKFELLQVEEVDHDNDGIPSYVEDLNDDFDVFDDDTDEDNFPNFIDLDDDDDDVITLDELLSTEYIIDTIMGEEEPILNENEFVVSREEVNGVITINTVTIVDSNSDGIPDYLDETITINYNEEESN